MQAPVEIRYEGAVLAKGVSPSGTLDEGGTLFLPLADPMPVGTRLELWSEHDGAPALVRVVKVTESADAAVAGVAVRPANLAEPIEPLELEPPLPAPVAAPARPPSIATAATPATSVSGEFTATPHAGNGQSAGAIPTIVTAENSAPIELDKGEGDDTTSTSEYPALSNGTPKRRPTRRTKKR